MAARKTSKRKAPRASARPPARPDAAGKAWLRWLKVRRFRHVEPCELHFTEGFNVLLGLNGTGKTTLLEILAAALRSNFSHWRKEPFSFEYELVTPGSVLRIAVENVEVTPGFNAERLGTTIRGEANWQPQFELKLFSPEGRLRLNVRADVAGSDVTVDGQAARWEFPRAGFLHGGPLVLMTWGGALQSGEDEIGELLVDAAGPWENTRRFDEALGFLQELVGSSSSVEVYTYAGRAGAHAISSGALGADMRHALIGALAGTSGPAPPTVTLDSDAVPVLKRIAELLDVARVEARFSHLETKVQGADEVRRYGNPSFMLTRADGSATSHELLSYGQKRALSFLCYLDANPATVVADELVDGLHHSWIEAAVAAIGKRQAFLASQNPLLLDYLEFDSAAKVQSSFIQCRLRRDEKGTDRMLWANMSEYDAARFFDAYQVGLQHVSEILVTRGLW